ncbi:MAG: hypothetical protein RI988_2464 [Pseudomonadota bacterium]
MVKSRNGKPRARLAGWMALSVWLLSSFVGVGPGPVHAQTRAAAPDPLAHKVATDLRLAIDAAKPARQPWLREAAGQRWVRVVVTGQRRSAELAEARKEITQRGGNVVSHDPAIATVVAVLPASQVRGVAARADVLHIAPDRTMESAPKAPPVQASSAHLAAYGLGPNSARAISDKALLGE